ncbi:MAG: DUF1559 domain-containing protein [Planctomycetes bacterium]|nr:DUF1559 domain-containing protein [Planctomycetota bacterium]
MSTKRPGLTLTELIVALIVTITLFSFAVLWLRQPRTYYDRTHTLNNLKQMALACHNAQDIYRRLPPAWGPCADAPAGSATVHYHLLPFLEQETLYKTYSPSATVPPFVALYDTKEQGGIQNFAANLRVFSKLGLDTPYNVDIAFGDPSDATTWDTGDGAAQLPKSFEDGTSNTILFATRYSNNLGRPLWPGAPNCSAYDGKPYYENGAFFGSVAARSPADNSTDGIPTFQLAPQPTSVDCGYSAFAHSYDVRSLLIALGDASVRSIAPALSPETWNRALHPKDGRALGEDWND